MAEAIGARPAAAHRVVWLCVLAAPPLAWLTAHLGFGLSLADPWHDGTVLALASVAEEIVFRGGVQTFLLRWPVMRRKTFLFSGANLVTSVVFAAFHLWRHPLPVVLGVFPISLVLGHVREASGRTWPAALLHVWFNAALCAATLLVGGTR
jgi:membrane protease YdiL (CAAX protease family)